MTWAILDFRTRRKQGDISEAIRLASEVIQFRPYCYEAYWARAKARKEVNQMDDALSDLREAIKKSPRNMELHRFTMQVKAEIEGIQANKKNESAQGSKISLIPEIIIASTQKKELESEV